MTESCFCTISKTITGYFVVPGLNLIVWMLGSSVALGFVETSCWNFEGCHYILSVLTRVAYTAIRPNRIHLMLRLRIRINGLKNWFAQRCESLAVCSWQFPHDWRIFITVEGDMSNRQPSATTDRVVRVATNNWRSEYDFFHRFLNFIIAFFVPFCSIFRF